MVRANRFLQPRLVFTEIPRGVFGVGEAFSAAQAGFYQEFPKVCLAWAKHFLQPRLVFTGITRPVDEAFYAAQVAFDLN